MYRKIRKNNIKETYKIICDGIYEKQGNSSEKMLLLINIKLSGMIDN